MHELVQKATRRPELKRKKVMDHKGVEHPMPKSRKGDLTRHVITEPAPVKRFIALPPGSKLAGRFPQHVQRVSIDQRMTPG